MYLSIGLNHLRVSMVHRTVINRYNLEFKNASYLEQKGKFHNKTQIFKDKLNNSSTIIPGLHMKFQIPRSRVNSELTIGDKTPKFLDLLLFLRELETSLFLNHKIKTGSRFGFEP